MNPPMGDPSGVAGVAEAATVTPMNTAATALLAFIASGAASVLTLRIRQAVKSR